MTHPDWPKDFGDLPREEQLRIFSAWLDGQRMERWVNQITGWVETTWPPFKNEPYRIAADAQEHAQ